MIPIDVAKLLKFFDFTTFALVCFRHNKQDIQDRDKNHKFFQLKQAIHPKAKFHNTSIWLMNCRKIYFRTWDTFGWNCFVEEFPYSICSG